MGLKFKRLVKNTVKYGTGVGFIENAWDSVSGKNDADRAAIESERELSESISRGQRLSEEALDSQLGVLGDTNRQQLDLNRDNYNAQRGLLGDTYRDQRGQIQSALQGANSQDQQALAQYMQAQGASQDQISQMLGQQAGLQSQFQDSVANASTLDGFGNMLNEVRDSDTYNSLLGERMDAATNQLQDAGLRRSTNAGEMAADISQDTLMGLANQNYDRQLGMLNMGNQGVNNQANFLNNSNNMMNSMNLQGQNAMNNRAYESNLGLADLMGQYGANQMGLRSNMFNNQNSLIGGYGQNQIQLMGQNAANQMNLEGQLGQAQAASTMAQGQNAMNSRNALFNLGGSIVGGYLSGGA